MAGNWTNSEKTELAKLLAIMSVIQKSYGREIDIKMTINAWEYVIGEYRASQVLAATEAYMKKSNDIPSPADLIKIIEPPPAKITYAEYKHALERHAAGGYNPNGKWYGTIQDYENQKLAESETPSYYEILEKREKWALENKSTGKELVKS